MTDQKPENQDISTPASQDAPVDASRRRLTGGALGVAAVFTLASRPVWANQCTISGMMSGNLSKPQGPACEGCTPGYWKVQQHHDSWTGFQTTDKFNTVFGVTQYVKANGNKMTLLEVLNLTGNQDPIFPELGGHAVSALLNAANSSVNYGYTSGEIINLFKTSLATPEKLKNSFDDMNNRGCPLN
jgi:hypothetical protein